MPLSRVEPRFGRGGLEAPLATPYVSRKAAELCAVSAGGVVIKRTSDDARLVVNGSAVAAERVVSAFDIERGVVIELGGRVVVLLHRASLGDRPADLGLVGESSAIDRVRYEIERVADLDVPVLIRGATGVGKEHVARAIYRASSRSDAPFLAVNMSTIPPTTAASELFGHVKGAFTGAAAARAGLFESADGGTLFLDEIGETPDSVQPMLLRVLEAGEISFVGDHRARRVDVRVIAATDSNLEEEVQKGRFRAALLHRLQGFEIEVPQLRDRRDDIGRLFLHFLELELERVGELTRLREPAPGKKPWLPARLMVELLNYPWPGNVRQLRNMVRQLVISSRSEEHARVSAVLERLLTATGSGDATVALTSPPSEISEERLLAALRAAGWSVGKAARALGVARSTLNDRVKKSPNVRRARDISADELREVHVRTNGDIVTMVDELCVSRRALTLRLSECGIG